MEPTTGIEPVNLFLTKEALYLLSYVGYLFGYPVYFPVLGKIASKLFLERETRFELATSSLEG